MEDQNTIQAPQKEVGKGRVKARRRRRRRTRAARRLAAQESSEAEATGLPGGPTAQWADGTISPNGHRPQLRAASGEDSTEEALEAATAPWEGGPVPGVDGSPFAKSPGHSRGEAELCKVSRDIFSAGTGSQSVERTTPKAKIAENPASPPGGGKEKSPTFPALREASSDGHLFQSAKPKPAKETSPFPLLEEEEDLFTDQKVGKSESRPNNSQQDVVSTTQDIFEGRVKARRRRRRRTRAARRLAAQESSEAEATGLPGGPTAQWADGTISPNGHRPQLRAASGEDSTEEALEAATAPWEGGPVPGVDGSPFAKSPGHSRGEAELCKVSRDIFSAGTGSQSVERTTPKAKIAENPASPPGGGKEKSPTFPALREASSDGHLFQSAKPKPAKETSPFPLLEEEEDLFTDQKVGKSESRPNNSQQDVVSTTQDIFEGRVKARRRRRRRTRAARRLAAQESSEAEATGLPGGPTAQWADGTISPNGHRPQLRAASGEDSTEEALEAATAPWEGGPVPGVDGSPFAKSPGHSRGEAELCKVSRDIFSAGTGSQSVERTTPKAKIAENPASPPGGGKEKSPTFPALREASSDGHLFQSAKPKPAKETSPFPLLEEEEDLFTDQKVGKSESRPNNSQQDVVSTTQDIFEGRVKARRRRRRRTRAARRLAAQESSEAEATGLPGGPTAQWADGTISPNGHRPQLRAASGEDSTEEALEAATAPWEGGPVPGVDGSPFAKSPGHSRGEAELCKVSRDIFSAGTGSQSVERTTPKAKIAENPASPPGGGKEKSPTFPALREASSDGHLFQSAKPKPAKETSPFPLLEEEEDLFTDQKVGKSESRPNNSQQDVVSTTQDIFEGRVKARRRRRRRTRAARRLAAQESSEAEATGLPGGPTAQWADGTISPNGHRPQLRAASGEDSTEEALEAATAPWEGGPVPGVDGSPFAKSPGHSRGEAELCKVSRDIFSAGTGSQSVERTTPKAKIAENPASPPGGGKEKSPTFPALREASSDGHLFQSAKPKPAKETSPFPLLEEEEDLFTDQKVGKSESRPNNSQQDVVSTTQDIFEGRVKARRRRRRRTRAARRLAAQESSEAEATGLPGGPTAQWADGTISPNGHRPQLRAASGEDSTEEALEAATAPWEGGPVPGVDGSPFAKSPGHSRGEAELCKVSRDIFSAGTGSQSVERTTPKAKIAENPASPPGGGKEKSPTFPALREASSDGHLFQSAKPKPAKETSPFPLLEEEEDLFTDQKVGKSESRPNNSQQDVVSTTQDIFEAFSRMGKDGDVDSAAKDRSLSPDDLTNLECAKAVLS
ncbi:WASH complex subunit 2-like [Aotus nancymaae]|uniref:WASH complex subunit 2-like n=1 Tax=Aotus nancymaae TaxID=37293 RepID=UPI0030FE1A0C